MKYKPTEIYNSIKDHLSEHPKTIKNAMLSSLVTIIIATTGCGMTVKRTDLWKLEERYGYQMEFDERVYGDAFRSFRGGGGMGGAGIGIGNISVK